jgi:hypothetical protein
MEFITLYRETLTCIANVYSRGDPGGCPTGVKLRKKVGKNEEGWGCSVGAGDLSAFR